MAFTTVGKNKLALLMAYGSGTSFPRFCAIGSGSGLVSSANTALIAEVGSRASSTGLVDVSTAREVFWQFDFSSVAMSGISLKEFAVFDTDVPTSGTMWNREGFGAVTFDGSNELQVEISFTIF